MNDPKIYKNVRLALTRLRLDTNTVHIRCEKGIVSLSGRLQFLFAIDGRTAELGFELLHEMNRQLCRVEGVTRVDYQLDNWLRNSDGNWQQKKRMKLRE